MYHEVVANLSIGLDPFDDLLGSSSVAEPAGGRGNKCLNVKFVRVAEQSDHGLLIIGFVGDVGENDQAGFCNCAGEQEERGEQDSDRPDHGGIENEIGLRIERNFSSPSSLPAGNLV